MAARKIRRSGEGFLPAALQRATAIAAADSQESPAPDISVVVPVYNEESNVRPLAAEVFHALSGKLSFELIFVDDGSSDKTGTVLSALENHCGWIDTCAHEHNRGQSAAVRTGVERARAAIVAVLDGDCQNDPHDILAMYDSLTGDDALNLIIGERQERKDRWGRRVASRIANGVRSRLLGDGIRDTGCGIKIFRRDEFLELPAFDHMHRFLPALFQIDGGRVASVPVRHRPRLSGQSKYGLNNRLWVGISDLFGVMWLKKRRL